MRVGTSESMPINDYLANDPTIPQCLNCKLPECTNCLEVSSQKIADQKYYEKHKAKRLAYAAEYRKKNRDKINARKRAYRKEQKISSSKVN